MKGIGQRLGIRSGVFVGDNAQLTSIQHTKQQCHVYLDCVTSCIPSALRDYAQESSERVISSIL